MEGDLSSEVLINNWPRWPNTRGWIALGTFLLAVMLLWMMKEDRSLREDEFFQTIATVIIANGLMAVIAWASGSTITGAKLAESNARVVESQAVPASPLATPEPLADSVQEGARQGTKAGVQEALGTEEEVDAAPK